MTVASYKHARVSVPAERLRLAGILYFLRQLVIILSKVSFNVTYVFSHSFDPSSNLIFSDFNVNRQLISNHYSYYFFQVECFAPYDDHRWVNIGKEKNGIAPDAVQYARALRPPFQLLSFLRIKGNCMKGMGCSNKNTMVS